MRIALFGGSFDPVHYEHIRLVEAAIGALSLDKVIILPSFIAPHKRGGAFASPDERFTLCELAFRDFEGVEVSRFELDAGDTSYTYKTAEHFASLYPGDELYFLVGADMLEDFFRWKYPERILQCLTLAACGRGGEDAGSLHSRFIETFHKDYAEIPFCGKEVSSTQLRCALYFGKDPGELPPAVLAHIKEQKLYSHPAIAPALALEKPSRQEHSYRVGQIAAKRARSAGVQEEKAIIAAALHDCGKYVPLSSPMLKGFSCPQNVPEPVLHQYTGAYLAEHQFGIRDEEILDAIRFHTSGKGDMSPLGKLIFLADMLEEGRDFEGIEELRRLYFEDLDRCLYACLFHQLKYLKEGKKPVYPLTEQAFYGIKAQFEG